MPTQNPSLPYGFIMEDYFIITPYFFGLLCELIKLTYAIFNSDLGFKALVKVSKFVFFISRLVKNLLSVRDDPGLVKYRNEIRRQRLKSEGGSVE